MRYESWPLPLVSVKIPGLDREAALVRLRPYHLVRMGEFLLPGLLGQGAVQIAQHMGAVLHLVGDHVNDQALALQLAAGPQQARAHDDRPERLKHFRPDDDVGDAGFILQGGEDDALGAARALAHQYQAGDADGAVRRQIAEAGIVPFDWEGTPPWKLRP